MLALDTVWKELLMSHQYAEPSVIDLDPNIFSTLRRLWWSIPLFILIYLVVILGMTVYLIQYLAQLEQNPHGPAPRRQRRMHHVRQIQTQRL